MSRSSVGLAVDAVSHLEPPHASLLTFLCSLLNSNIFYIDAHRCRVFAVVAGMLCNPSIIIIISVLLVAVPETLAYSPQPNSGNLDGYTVCQII